MPKTKIKPKPTLEKGCGDIIYHGEGGDLDTCCDDDFLCDKCKKIYKQTLTIAGLEKEIKERRQAGDIYRERIAELEKTVKDQEERIKELGYELMGEDL